MVVSLVIGVAVRNNDDTTIAARHLAKVAVIVRSIAGSSSSEDHPHGIALASRGRKRRA